jgi:hypothetical protein
MQPFVLDGVAERARDGLLPRHFLKCLRTPLACDDLIGHLFFVCSVMRTGA